MHTLINTCKICINTHKINLKKILGNSLSNPGSNVTLAEVSCDGGPRMVCEGKGPPHLFHRAAVAEDGPQAGREFQLLGLISD